MTKFIDFLPLFFESIKAKNTNFLVECYLNERYIDLNFTKDEALNSLKVIYSDLTNTDPNNIVNDLSNEFLSVGVIFQYIKDTSSYNYTWKKAGILKNEYDSTSNLITLYITDIFIKNFLNKNFDILAEAITAAGCHEDTHRQQWELSHGKAKGTSTNLLNNPTQVNFKTYLENPTEIDAHAREVAIYLYNKKLTANQIINLLNTNNKDLMEISSYKKYWDTFGIMLNYPDILDKDGINRLKTWKRFLKRIIAYLQTTIKYKYSTLIPQKALQQIDKRIKDSE